MDNLDNFDQSKHVLLNLNVISERAVLKILHGPWSHKEKVRKLCILIIIFLFLAAEPEGAARV